MSDRARHIASSTAQPHNERIEDDAWDGVPDHLRGTD